MKTKILVLLCALMAAPWALAFQDEAKQDDPSMAAFKKASAGYQEQMNKYRAGMKDIKTRAEFNKYRREHFPKPDETVKLLMAVVKEHPKSNGAFESLSWIISNDRANGSKVAMPILARDFIAHEKIGALCGSMGRNVTMESKKFLEGVLAKNNHKQCKAQACFALAQWHSSAMRNLGYMTSDDERMAQFGQRMAKDMGEETVAYVKKLGNAGLEKGALAHYQRIASEFGDVDMGRRGKMGPIAQGQVNKMTKLKIGKVAPDIAAEDVDGVAFKLSDYRGKVVVLDFWGDW